LSDILLEFFGSPCWDLVDSHGIRAVLLKEQHQSFGFQADYFRSAKRKVQICKRRVYADYFRSAKRKVQICKRRVYYSIESVRQHQGLDKDTFKMAMALRMEDRL
jgi:hypothetical protein